MRVVPFGFTIALLCSLMLAFMLLVAGVSGAAGYIVWALVFVLPVAVIDLMLFVMRGPSQ